MNESSTLPERVDAELAAKGVSPEARAKIREMYERLEAAKRFAKKSEAARL